MHTQRLTTLLTSLSCATALWFGAGIIPASAAADDAAFTQPDSSIVDAAKKEGDVTWYSVLDPNQMNKLAERFEDQYGIHVNVIRSTTGKLVQRYSSELSADKVTADILSVSDALYYDGGAPNGTFKELSATDIPNLKQWPDDAVVAGSALVLSVNPFVIAYNTNRVKNEDAPKEWKDLLSSKFAGDMGAPNFSVSSTYVEFLSMWKNTMGDEFLKKYGEQEKRYYDSSVPGNQALAAGEFAVFAPTMPIFAQPIIDKGAPIKLVFPANTTGNVIHAAISADAPHPNAALLLMNYLTSHEAQEMINKGVSATLLPNVKGSIELPAEYTAPKPKEASERKDELLDAIGLHG